MADVASDTNVIPCQQRQHNTVVLFDDLWKPGNDKFQIVSANQGGDGRSGGDHYLQVNENTGIVSADGMWNSKSTLFKEYIIEHKGPSGALEILFMLEWIGGRDSGQDGRMVAIVDDRLTSIVSPVGDGTIVI